MQAVRLYSDRPFPPAGALLCSSCCGCQSQVLLVIVLGESELEVGAGNRCMVASRSIFCDGIFPVDTFIFVIEMARLLTIYLLCNVVEFVGFNITQRRFRLISAKSELFDR